MKRILGLDLGSASIGWALVNEAENKNEKSSIVKIGSRIIQYGDNLVKVDKSGQISSSFKPEEDFQSGKGLSPNAGRTKQRGARRNLQRYKLRRENLISILKEKKIINDDFIYSELGNSSTFRTYRNRALAATTEISLDDFVGVLLMINKKRGYKSSRKAKGEDEGQLIDGMAVAMQLYENNETPGQFVFQLLKKGKKYIPDFYRSDLQAEFDKIWKFQEKFYPLILTNENYEKLKGQSRKTTSDLLTKVLKIETPEIKGNWDEKRLQRFELRSNAIAKELNIGEVAECLIEINNSINQTSGYLGEIGDRSKELVFQKLTVGQYLYKQIEADSNASLKKQIFYRQDFLDEFNTIWDVQAQYHKALTQELKSEIRDVIIFYQRKLKSQKGLLSFCELESKKIEVIVDGKTKVKTRGMRVIPKSSPLFQEFKIWQILNNIEVIDVKTKQAIELSEDEKNILFEELNIKDKISKKDALKLLFDKPSNYDLNFEKIEGNKTNAALYSAYQKICELSGHDHKDCTKLNSIDAKDFLTRVFFALNINTKILEFDSSLIGSAIEQQLHFQLWHLLYSYEGDNSNTGNEKLLNALKTKFGFEREYAQVIINVGLPQDYGSLSAKAIRKILPHLKSGFSYGGRKDKPTEPSAVEYAGYRKHSKAALTRDEIDTKSYKHKLEVLPKNSLRNPIVEKIINQMVNVVNTTIDEFGKPDEIRIELARELKKSSEERQSMTEAITKSTAEHENYRKILQSEFGLKHVSKNDLIRYKLYLELKRTGFKTLYSNTYISPDRLFSKEFDIEHILPKAKLFDDSFSNKTLELKSINVEKGDKTAYDFVKDKYGEEELMKYEQRVQDLFLSKKGKDDNEQESKSLASKDTDKRISKTKRDKLLMPESKIPSGFIERELRDTQYIAKKAKTMLEEICKTVTTTTGIVTDRLREDWQLIDVMQELNWEKYKALGLTSEFTNREGNVIKRIADWTKRNDHRHHAMDALTVAFTKPSYIQYLNNLNARSDKSSSIYGIEQKELLRDKNNRLRFIPPMALADFRAEVKKQLENTLISFKANNKVVTKNTNKFKTKKGVQSKTELTPRGQLHQETIYGSLKRYKTTEVKINASLDLETINRVAKKKVKEALLKRLAEFDNDSKKAFAGKNSIDKNPIYVGEHQSFKIPDKVKLVSTEIIYTIRKEITPDIKIEKVIDSKIKSILEARLKEYGNAKEAFSNLKDNPIWLNKEKGIAIKRVTISGISNAVSLRTKKDLNGKLILNSDGNKIAVDFVNTGANHHVAIYKDEKGELQDRVVSFYEAVERVNQGLNPIDYDYNKNLGWSFQFTMKQNECFVFTNEKTGFNPNEIDLLDFNNYHLISPNLFRVQKFSKLQYGNSFVREYVFRHHLETTLIDKKEMKEIAFKNIKSLPYFKDIVKVRINHIGKIVKVGE
jgi:CRISPR-associated endonuclease Csn1